MRRSVRIAVAGFFIVIVLAPVVNAVPNRMLAIVAIGVVAVVVFAMVVKAVHSTGDGSGSSWDLIPRWQYEGRHVEMGGATRTEQERAIEEIQEEAVDRDQSQS